MPAAPFAPGWNHSGYNYYDALVESKQYVSTKLKGVIVQYT